MENRRDGYIFEHSYLIVQILKEDQSTGNTMKAARIMVLRIRQWRTTNDHRTLFVSDRWLLKVRFPNKMKRHLETVRGITRLGVSSQN